MMYEEEKGQLLIRTVQLKMRESKIPGDIVAYAPINPDSDPHFLIEWRFSKRLFNTKYNFLRLADDDIETIYERAEKFVNSCKEIFERIKKEQGYVAAD